MEELFGTWGLKSPLVLRAVSSADCWKQKSRSCGALQALVWVMPAVNEPLASGLQAEDYTVACMNTADFMLASTTALSFAMGAWVFCLRLGGLA